MVESWLVWKRTLSESESESRSISESILSSLKAARLGVGDENAPEVEGLVDDVDGDAVFGLDNEAFRFANLESI